MFVICPPCSGPVNFQSFFCRATQLNVIRLFRADASLNQRTSAFECFSTFLGYLHRFVFCAQSSPVSSPLPAAHGDRCDEAKKCAKYSISSHAPNASGLARQHALAASQSIHQQFRQQTLSASSSWQRPNANASSLLQQRRHSSSIPGRAHRALYSTPQEPRESPTSVKDPTPRLPLQDVTISKSDLKDIKKVSYRNEDLH